MAQMFKFVIIAIIAISAHAVDKVYTDLGVTPARVVATCYHTIADTAPLKRSAYWRRGIPCSLPSGIKCSV